MIFIASFSHPWRNLQQMMVRSKSESKFMGSLYQIYLNKSSVSQYCILPRLILVARSSIAFYFVNISLVPVHSALSIARPGSMRTLISVCDSALRAPATLVLTRHNEMRVGGKLHQTCPSIMGRWQPSH